MTVKLMNGSWLEASILHCESYLEKNTGKFNYGTVILFLQLMMELYGFTNSVA